MSTARLDRSQHTHFPMPDFLRPDDQPACREPGIDPDLFFPLGDQYSDEAREVCHRCPVVEACGQWATDTGMAWGLWGGLTPEQRKFRREMQRVLS